MHAEKPVPPAAASLDCAVEAPYEIDPRLAQEVNARLERLDGERRLEMVQLMHTILLCFDPEADAEATVLFRRKGILQVIGVNSLPQSSAMMIYAANMTMNDPKGAPPREQMN